ncbi:putative sulfate exporter family transporter [Thermoproteus tenax]|uniref:Conserved membrane protein n=1 Tax=Thermoproteus tenax (strain ATCC 35583 / DSM 2078 / JCM 9277 / NBRC 100435 / Kra 1) TaxID=768679 RepID=G4RK10_THETK|nr:putative sulfate exporter family transporter [Thermoproteus tenax]CCC81905.1 conserved membrane protein [Thermoproteus tenax Kra 1]
MSSQKIDWRPLYKKEDWWALWLGLALFFYSLVGFFSFRDILGWVPTWKAWTDISSPVAVPNPKLVLGSPWVNLVVAWIALMLLLMGPAKLIGVRPSEWVKGFTVIYWLWWISAIIIGYKPIANAVTTEFTFTLALLISLIIGNMPKVPQWLLNSARGEWFIKTALVLLGAKILFTDWIRYGGTVLLMVLIGFPAFMFLTFPLFKLFTRNTDLSVVATAGTSICGVAAAIAAAGAINAPAIYPAMVSAAVLIFAAVELVILPWIAIGMVKAGVLSPAAAGAWMGLSVKTDGAAAASAEIVARGVGLDAPLTIGVMTKMLIDIWIGVVAFVLALIWAFFVEPRRSGGAQSARRRPSPMELWFRFPKFVLGYFFTSLAVSALIAALAGSAFAAQPNPIDAATKAVVPVVVLQGTDPFRVLLFGLTFIAIGLNTRFSLMKQYKVWNLFISFGIARIVVILIALLLVTLFFPK